MSSKITLRKKYNELREALTPDSVEEMSLEIANQALKLPIWNKTNYHLFLSISSKKEVSTDYLLHILQGKEKSVIISKSDFSTGEMKHILLQENTLIKTSSYGIPEPVSGIEIAPDTIEVVFVPLLAFDLLGHGVGYGKGFYDRFLEKCKPETIFVGMSFFGPEERIISESLDVPLHYCITPNKIFEFN